VQFQPERLQVSRGGESREVGADRYLTKPGPSPWRMVQKRSREIPNSSVPRYGASARMSDIMHATPGDTGELRNSQRNRERTQRDWNGRSGANGSRIER
jgi:hypothetical protein